MKRFVLSLMALSVLSMLAFAFMYSPTPASSSNNWSLYKVDSLQFMSIDREQTSFSPLQTSIFTSRLRNGNMPFSVSLSFLNKDYSSDVKKLMCKLEYNGVVLETELKDVETLSHNDSCLYKGVFEYNLADLLGSMNEADVVAFMQNFPETPKVSILPVYEDSTKVEINYIPL